MPLPDLRLKDIGKKSNGAPAGEAARQILDTITPQVTQSMASRSISTAGQALLKGVEGVPKTMENLFK